MKLYQNGASTSMGGKSGKHIRAKRGVITGWSAAAARRQRNWLWTIDAPSLDGVGYAVTLTVRDLPESAEEWGRLRRAWVKRIERMGASRIHWVTEWQERGVPHIHAAIYFDDAPAMPELLAVHWIVVASSFGATLQGQDVKLISGTMGWLKYLAKHASRGASHYQRQQAPEGWEKAGRLWGHTGTWPEIEPLVIEGLSNHEFWRVRRIMRRWAVNQAAVAADFGRVRYLRRAGRPSTKFESSFQGVSEWIPEGELLRLIDYLERENS